MEVIAECGIAIALIAFVFGLGNNSAQHAIKILGGHNFKMKWLEKGGALIIK